MPARFTDSIRSLLADSLVSSIENRKPEEWQQGKEYHIGDKVISNYNIYVATSNGISGNSAPLHTTGIASDGNDGVNWVYVEPAPKHRTFESNIYLAIGKKTAWPDEQVPPGVSVVDFKQHEAMEDIISLKRILPENVRLCAQRYDWSFNHVFDQYDDSKEFNDYPYTFYVVNSNNDIYVCLDNFNGAMSTVEPTITSTFPFRTSDGYVWKYIGSIHPNDVIMFATNDFIPVKKVNNAFENPNQWAVQQSAKRGSISTFKIKKIVSNSGNTAFSNPVVHIIGNGTGAIANTHLDENGELQQVYIINPGENYTKWDTYAMITEGNPPGSGAFGTVNINEDTGSITSIDINNGGSDYQQAIAVLVGYPKEGKTLQEPTSIDVQISNGSITNVIINGQTANYESAYIYFIPGSIGAIAHPVMAPTNGHGSDIIKELSATTVMISTRLTNTNNDNGYFLTENSEDTTFRQVLLVSEIRDKNTNKYCNDYNYIGPSHPQYDNQDSLLKKIKKDTGIVLYIDNIKAITRNENQEEDIKIAITL